MLGSAQQRFLKTVQVEDKLTAKGNFNVETPTVPVTATSTGTAGDIAWDSTFIYVCVATDSWKRVAIAAW